MRILIWTVTFILTAVGTFPAHATSVIAKAPEYAAVCTKAVTAAELEYKLPKRLLTAISLTESGHWHKEKQEMIAWPWTVYAEGRGRYLPNKAAAIKEVKMLKEKGVTNIDVGCMQVNLHYHPEAFDDLESALDPTQNTLYAAQLLKSLREESRSWNLAVAHYHSRNSKFNVPYRQKVLKIWQKERRKDTEVRMSAAREAYKLKREQMAERIKEASQRRFTEENIRKLSSAPAS
ncbi:transglycosylase SLT domain-containing protein [uncultured Sneathiella sp.]|uniref:transglycosylase SLT domain-containing protein n=1 Tax=uncultured Sneathiella sp. TaxID=879315 RepID=UPI0030EC9859|tara:strand:+ start:14243 stop:14944 length:702 start_codon:yes stop_codon:yes gene_type:complete